jgi:hypothetical protein
MGSRLIIVSVSTIVAAIAVVPSGSKNREAKSISRMLVASAMIAVATSAWGCSSRVEPFDVWDSSPYPSFTYSPGNAFETSAAVAYVDSGDDPGLARSGYTDPCWERAELGSERTAEDPPWEGAERSSERTGDVSFPVNNDRVLEIPQMLDRDDTAAATLFTGGRD